MLVQLARGLVNLRDLRAFGWLDLAMRYVAECEVFATEFDFSETDSEALSLRLNCQKEKIWSNGSARKPGGTLIAMRVKNLAQMLKHSAISIPCLSAQHSVWPSC